MKHVNHVVTLSLLLVGAVIQGCGVAPARHESVTAHRRNSSAITVVLAGKAAILKNARISMFSLADGAPSWVLDADGPDGHGTVEITCLQSVIEKATTYVLDDQPASEHALLVLRANRGLLAYSLDASRMSSVVIESVSGDRVTGRFTLNLVGQTAGQPPVELICEHFDLPLVSERDGWW